jgi:protein-tyrosine phosphatase
MQPEIFWIPSPWPGRLATLPRPRGEDWLEDEISGFRQVGVDVMVSALESAEAAELGLIGEAETCQRKGIEFISFPIPDRGVPKSVQIAQELAQSLKIKLASGKNVAIHCRAGVGRSSVLAACVLMLAGMDSETAFDRIQLARGMRVPDCEEQKDWVERFGKALSTEDLKVQ